MNGGFANVKIFFAAALLACALCVSGCRYFGGGASSEKKAEKTKTGAKAKTDSGEKVKNRKDDEKKRADYVHAAADAMGLDDTDTPISVTRALDEPEKLLPEWFNLAKPALGGPLMYFNQYAREMDAYFAARAPMNDEVFDEITDLNEAGRLIAGLDIEDIIDEQFQIIVRRYHMEELVKDNPAIKELLKLQILKKLLEYVAENAGETQGLSAFLAGQDSRLWENLFSDNQQALETPDALNPQTPSVATPDTTMRTPGAADMPDGFAPGSGSASPGFGSSPGDDEARRRVSDLEGFPDHKSPDSKDKPGTDEEFPEFPDEFSAPRE